MVEHVLCLHFCAETALCYRMRDFRLRISGQLRHFSGVRSQCSVFMKFSGLSFKRPELSTQLSLKSQMGRGVDYLTVGVLFGHLFFFLSQLNEKLHVLCFLFLFGYSKIPKHCL